MRTSRGSRWPPAQVPLSCPHLSRLPTYRACIIMHERSMRAFVHRQANRQTERPDLRLTAAGAPSVVSGHVVTSTREITDRWWRRVRKFEKVRRAPECSASNSAGVIPQPPARATLDHALPHGPRSAFKAASSSRSALRAFDGFWLPLQFAADRWTDEKCDDRNSIAMCWTRRR